jgi:hypothetical protein
MESYKHSCPTCGQHIEYTAGYCGRQMQCPICGNTITFPAIPPASGGKKIADEQPKPARQWSWNLAKIFVSVRDFPHWNTVMQILIPFVIIGALLAGALFVKNKFSDQPEASTPVVQAPVGGWDKMNELARADQKMQKDVQAIAQTKKSLASAQAMLNAEQKRLGQARDSDEKQTLTANVQSVERSVNQAQNALATLRQQFQADMEKYRKLGGTIDYYSRVY